jgi:hypothetical protein
LKKVNVNLLWNTNSDGCSAVQTLNVRTVTGQKPTYTQYDELPDQPGKVIGSNCYGAVDQTPDLAINDVSWTSCLLSYGDRTPLAAGLKEFVGPVQGLVPIVQSSYTYYNDIMVEELQDLYICGGNGNILTFSSDQFIFDYNNNNSGMREAWARGLGLANASPLDIQIGLGGSNNLYAETMVTVAVVPSPAPTQTIGYTSTEFYDLYRGEVNGFKVRGLNQNLAYWPDSSMTSTDKINIREGRYTLQNALHLVTPVDANGVPTNPLVGKVIDWFQQSPTAAPLPFDVNEIYALRGVVPQCAMKVAKDRDASPFKHYSDPLPCHCSFQVLATGNTSIPGCLPCGGVDAGTEINAGAGVDAGTEIGAGTCQSGQICSHGYCEQVN